MGISILIFLLLYIYGVLGVFVFGDNDKKYFGDLGTALITLFRVMTMDHWGEVLYIELYGCNQEYSARDKDRWGCDKSSGGFVAVLYFLTFIMVVSFIILNLFIGVVTSSLNQATKEVKSDPETTTDVDEYEEPTNPRSRPSS